MSEWWTYRLEDFLMFSPATYQRMFALYNAQVWPAQWVALPLGLWLLWLAAQRPAWGARMACAILALAWACTAWAFHAQRYASVHTAAPWFAAAFMVQALLLAGAARTTGAWPRCASPAWARGVGWGLLAAAVLLWPAVAMLLGRPWQQAALFGLTPDATAVATLGLLLLLPARAPWLWALPLLWCAVSAATLWAMAMPEWWLIAMAAVLALMGAMGPRCRMPTDQ